MAHLGDGMAVKDKVTKCSPLPPASVISIYFMLPLNSTTSPSNEIIGIPFIGVERRWGRKSPFGGAGNIVTQFLRPRRPSELSLHSVFSDSHMISGKRAIAGACSFLRGFLPGLLFVLRSLLNVPSLFLCYNPQIWMI